MPTALPCLSETPSPLPAACALTRRAIVCADTAAAVCQCTDRTVRCVHEQRGLPQSAGPASQPPGVSRRWSLAARAQSLAMRLLLPHARDSRRAAAGLQRAPLCSACSPHRWVNSAARRQHLISPASRRMGVRSATRARPPPFCFGLPTRFDWPVPHSHRSPHPGGLPRLRLASPSALRLPVRLPTPCAIIVVVCEHRRRNPPPLHGLSSPPAPASGCRMARCPLSACCRPACCYAVDAGSANAFDPPSLALVAHNTCDPKKSWRSHETRTLAASRLSNKGRRGQ
jgi:hypothetical protein